MVHANWVHNYGFHSYLSDAIVAEVLSLIGDEFLNFDVARGDGNYFSFVLRGLWGRTGSKELVPDVLYVGWRSASRPRRNGTRRGRNIMATVSDSSRTTERAISDLEFEALLQKTYEMVQNQKSLHPLEPAAESTSWT